MRKFLSLLFLVVTLVANTQHVEAKTYSGYGITMYMNDNFQYIQPIYNPKATTVMSARDPYDKSNVSLTADYYSGPEPTNSELYQAKNMFRNNFANNGFNVVGDGVFDIYGGHGGVYIITQTYLPQVGITLEAITAWTWLHNKKYTIGFRYPAASGRRQEMIDAVKSISCTAGH